MAVITISHPLGSGGSAITRLVAERLGFRVLDREIVGAVAARARVPVKAAQSFDEAHFEPLEGFGHELDLARDGHPLTYETYQYVASCAIRDAADKGSVVVVGRAGQVVLGERRDAFHVRVVAPFEDRVARVVEREGIGDEEAEERVGESDKGRQEYVRALSDRDWDDPLLYDLVVNTRLMSFETAAKLIAEAATAVLGIAVLGIESSTPTESHES